MLEDRRKIDDLFQNVLADYGEDMPDYSWDKIENEIKQDKRRKATYIWFSAAASIAIILAFAGGYMLSSSNAKKEMANITNDSNIQNHTNITSPDIQSENNSESIASDENGNYTADENSEQNLVATYNYSVQNNNTKQSDDQNAIAEKKQTHVDRNNRHVAPQSVKRENNNTPVEITVDQNNIEKNIEKNSLAETANNNGSITNENLAEVQSEEDKIAAANEGITQKDSVVKSVYLPINTIEYDNDVPPELLAEKSNWQVGGQFSPTYSPIQSILFSGKENDAANAIGNEYSDNNKSSRDNRSQETVLFSTGLGFRYFIRENWGLQSGLFYSRFSDGYEHVEIPGMLSYYPIRSRIDLNITAGVSCGTLLSQDTRKFDPINLNALAGVGIAINLTKKISFSLQPTLKYQLPINDNYFSYRRAMAYSIYTGLTYSL